MTILDPPDWQQRGKCSTGNSGVTDLFFPTRGQSSAPAKAICARCPVLDTCREYALANGERFGVWGGMSEKERRAERARRKAAGERIKRRAEISHGTLHGYYHCADRPEGACDPCRDVITRYKNPDPGDDLDIYSRYKVSTLAGRVREVLGDDYDELGGDAA